MEKTFETGDVVELLRFGETLTGTVTGVHTYPSGTRDYSVGCPGGLLFWIHVSRITRLVKAA